MTINVTLSSELGERLEVMAKATSSTPEQFAAAAIERNLLALERLEQSLAPVYAAFEASGLTEDEANDLFEAEKQAWRAEQRAAGES